MTEKTLYSFGATPTDAKQPLGQLVLGGDGNIYGTTYFGGRPGCGTGDDGGCGTVFKMSPAGEETIIYAFGGPGADDTCYPVSLIQASDGNFYGAADCSTGSNAGTIFQLTSQGVETILYAFSGGADGGDPAGLIQGSDGNFYGTTAQGGRNNCGCGTFFKLTPQGVETVLYALRSHGH